MILSNTNRNDGNMQMTTAILINAPLDIRLHSELIMSMSEYIPTPKVAAKKQNALIIMELIEAESAFSTASFFAFPWLLSLRYLVLIRMA